MNFRINETLKEFLQKVTSCHQSHPSIWADYYAGEIKGNLCKSKQSPIVIRHKRKSNYILSKVKCNFLWSTLGTDQWLEIVGRVYGVIMLWWAWACSDPLERPCHSPQWAPQGDVSSLGGKQRTAKWLLVARRGAFKTVQSSSRLTRPHGRMHLSSILSAGFFVIFN